MPASTAGPATAPERRSGQATDALLGRVFLVGWHREIDALPLAVQRLVIRHVPHGAMGRATAVRTARTSRRRGMKEEAEKREWLYCSKVALRHVTSGRMKAVTMGKRSARLGGTVMAAFVGVALGTGCLQAGVAMADEGLDEVEFSPVSAQESPSYDSVGDTSASPDSTASEYEVPESDAGTVADTGGVGLTGASDEPHGADASIYQATDIADAETVDVGVAENVAASIEADGAAATQNDDIVALGLGGASFLDTSADAWYAPYVEWAASEGLITGYKDVSGNYTGLFGPQDGLTRAQLAVILWRYAGSPSASSAGFSDTRGHWAEKAIDWCAQQGIVTGYSGTGMFGPDDGVTREQLCTMLWRNAGRPGGGISLVRWSDGGQVSSYASQAVAWAAGEGIMAGSVGNATVLLLPSNGATRAEAAKMLAVALGGYLGTTPEHQVLKSIEGWWTTNGKRPKNPYFHIHDGVVDCYSHDGTFASTHPLTETDIHWYPAGSFMHGRSEACYGFLYNGGYRTISPEHMQIYARGDGNQYSGSSSWSRSGVLSG